MNYHDNLFSHFSYSTWSPEGLQERFPTLESALCQLETSPILEAAFAVFWKLWESPDPDNAFPHIDPDLIEEAILKNNPNSLSTAVERANWEITRTKLEQQNQENRERTQARLAQLVERLIPSVEPDEPVVEKDSWVFAHIAGALVLELERLDAGQTERSREVVSQALSFGCRGHLPQAQNLGTSRPNFP